jgi:toxin ParE1/3/4
LKIKLLSAAEEDLNDICRYFYEENPGYTEKFLDMFERALKRLQKFPRSGRISETFILNRSGYRYIACGSFYIYYKIEEETIYVYRIVHNARDLQKFFNN